MKGSENLLIFRYQFGCPTQVHVHQIALEEVERRIPLRSSSSKITRL